MPEVKDSDRAFVRITYDGSVHKTFKGSMAQERFNNEVRVLRHLESKGCDFVPKIIEVDPDTLTLVTTSCGSRVERISPNRLKKLFAQLEDYGVRHDDPFTRNVTYRVSDGRFCLIDFELATLIDEKTEDSSTSKEGT